MPVVSQRLTVVPAAFFAMKFASRSSFISRAMRSSAKSQETRLNSLLPGARYLGYLQPRRRVHEIEQRRAFRAQRAAVHRMVRIALDVDDVRTWRSSRGRRGCRSGCRRRPSNRCRCCGSRSWPRA